MLRLLFAGFAGLLALRPLALGCPRIGKHWSASYACIAPQSSGTWRGLQLATPSGKKSWRWLEGQSSGQL
eukprot:10752978-Prorocentrum_lima.AAC.1